MHRPSCSARPCCKACSAILCLPSSRWQLRFLIYAVGWPLLKWAVINATWSGTTRNDCTGTGACWVFIRQRFGQFMYGLYPEGERWRVDAWALLMAGSALALFWKSMPARKYIVPVIVVAAPLIGIWLLGGGWGLKPVETRQWGGLSLTMFLAIYAGLIAIPLGILLALGRQSRLPVIRMISIIFIRVLARRADHRRDFSGVAAVAAADASRFQH